MKQPKAMAGAMMAVLEAPPDREQLREGAEPYVEKDQAERYLDILDRCTGK